MLSRIPAAILILSGKHAIHALVLILTIRADKVMNTWVLFQVLGSRVLVVAALLIAAALPMIGLIRRVPNSLAVMILAPQQFMLLLACCGSFEAIHTGITPSGRVVDWPLLLWDQAPLFFLAVIHFWYVLEYIRKTR